MTRQATTERLPAKDRTNLLIDAGLSCAERVGWSNLTRDLIAAEAQVTNGLISIRLGTMDQARRSIMRRAVERRSLKVVAEGLAVGDKTARKAPEDLKQEASQWLATR